MSFLASFFSGPRPVTPARASALPLVHETANRPAQKPTPSLQKRGKRSPRKAATQDKENRSEPSNVYDFPSDDDGDGLGGFATQIPHEPSPIASSATVIVPQSTDDKRPHVTTPSDNEEPEEPEDVDEEEQVILSQVPYDMNDDMDVDVAAADDPAPLNNSQIEPATQDEEDHISSQSKAENGIQQNGTQDGPQDGTPDGAQGGTQNGTQGDDGTKDEDEQYQFNSILDHRWVDNDIQVKVAWHNSAASWEPEANLHLDAPDALFAYWQALGGRPENPKDPGLFTVFAIRDHSRDRRRLLVEWTGYPREECTWESRRAIESAAPTLVMEYWHKVDSKTRGRPGRPKGSAEARKKKKATTRRRRY